MAPRLCAAAAILALNAFAGEYAVFATGYVQRVDRHETDGTTVRLYAGDGVTEVPASLVTSFEPDMTPPAKPQTAAKTQRAPVDARKVVTEAARQYAMNHDFVKLVQSVAKVESGYRADAVSPKGAVGLMQLMPSTAQALAADPHVPEQNADAGARYLAELLLKYQNDPDQVRKALAAYNAGPGAVDRYRGVPPYRETMQYVERVLKQYHRNE